VEPCRARVHIGRKVLKSGPLVGSVETQARTRGPCNTDTVN